MSSELGLTSRMNFSLTEAMRKSTREAVVSGATLNSSYLAMNTAAAIIAGFGLMENSPAVIIGAMLIAMLYGPIVGIAMALAEANLELLSRSLLAEGVGAAFVVSAGLLIGVLTRHLTIGSEIIGRTSPNLLDLLIALIGGFAGGFTFVSPGLSSVVVGVAIATALVPPLTTCGILLSRQLPVSAFGAFMLFLANFSAIALGAMIVFLIAGYRPEAERKSRSVWAPRSICAALVLLLAVHLSGNLLRTSQHSILQSNIRKALAKEIEKTPGARLIELTLTQKQGKINVWAVARTPQPMSPEQVSHLNDLANQVTGHDVELTVRSVLTAETTRNGNVYKPEIPPGEELK
jgi:uncharacterized hydrophobic protein (TIGR00271 family)